MKLISARNVHQALPQGIQLLRNTGRLRDSRNGQVIVVRGPVTTVYEKPMERVVFWPERDANPFLHVYESLWMLRGRNDVAPLLRYAKQFAQYSDDGVILAGAYGHRWRDAWDPCDQLRIIARQLRENPDDRRNVLQMWDVNYDLGSTSKDVPCNLIATFQRDFDGALDMTVFCRSNDVIWGAYGANAVHFAFLLEYMAHWIGCEPGRYTHVSVNYHAYMNIFEKVAKLPDEAFSALFTQRYNVDDPYVDGRVRAYALGMGIDQGTTDGIKYLDKCLAEITRDADAGNFSLTIFGSMPNECLRGIYSMLWAHHLWRTTKDYAAAYGVLDGCRSDNDWVKAGREWLQRREAKA